MAIDTLAIARRTLTHERDGLSALVDALDASFTRAVEMIEDVHNKKGGRVIITGMGKSGHVARKIAATLSSTGTPSLFVHPGEASHGDLGMITERDGVIALSNSGEAPELADIIAYTRRFAIPLIGITSKPQSSLGKHSDVCLTLPPVGEACPNGLAPTTSTTLMMALGDALAVSLLERLGLTAEQFRVFHPGGKLGQKLKKVTDLMDGYDALPLVEKTDTMDRAIMVMAEKNVGCAIVMEAPHIVAGIITDGDLKRHMDSNLLAKPVTDVMTTGPKTIAPDALADEAVDMMLRRFGRPITSLPVMDSDKRLVGLIRLQACLQAGVA